MSTISWTTLGTFNSMFGTTDLNSLASQSVKMSTLNSGGVTVDTTSSLHFHGVAEFTGGSISPAGPADVLFFLIPQLADGSTFMDCEDGSTFANQGLWVSMPHVSIPLRSKASSTQNSRSARFDIIPGKYRPALLNRSGVSLASSGNMVKLSLFTEQVA